jgi:hypothetical protein
MTAESTTATESDDRARMADFVALLTCDPADHAATIGLIARVSLQGPPWKDTRHNGHTPTATKGPLDDA